MEATESDLRLIQLELQQRQTELQNLQLALQQLQTDKEMQLQRLSVEADRKFELFQASCEQKALALTQEWQAKYEGTKQKNINETVLYYELLHLIIQAYHS